MENWKYEGEIYGEKGENKGKKNMWHIAMKK